MHRPGPLGHAYRLYATAGCSSLPWEHRVSQRALVVAHQSQPAIALRDMLEHLPAAVIAVRRELGRARARPGRPG